MPESETIVVDDVVYDTEKLASIHPGGNLFVELFDGKDASDAFYSYHRRNFPHDKLKQYQLLNQHKNNMDPLYLELCQEINQILPIHKSFAPWYYYIKAIGLLSITLWLESHIHANGHYHWSYMCTLGFLFALIGLNIQHDANHGAISRHFVVNRIFGLSQNWIGGSAIDWMHQHVVQHHIYCNDSDHDPDIYGNILLRFNPKQPLLQHHAFQWLYFLVLLLLFGFTYSANSILNNMNAWNHTSYSVKLHPYLDIERNVTILCALRWLFLPIIFTKESLFITYLQISYLFITGGFYLSFFFVLSHNYEGVLQYDSNNKIIGFLKKQVTTSSNVGGPLLGFINGGLNYQIEHHLFPRINHCHYPLIAPTVRQFCEKHQIKYTHFPSVCSNLQSCMRHLHHMGTLISPQNCIHEKND